MTGGETHSSQAGWDRGRLNYEENMEAVNIYGYQLIFGQTDTQARPSSCLGFPEQSRRFPAAVDDNTGLAMYIIIGLSHVSVRGEPGSRGGVAKNEQNESLPFRLQNTRHNFPPAASGLASQ